MDFDFRQDDEGGGCHARFPGFGDDYMNQTQSSAITRYFHLAERGTTVRTEVLAGCTTFLTMAYIVLVNPAILGQAGLPVASVAAATCFAAAFGSILMGLVANTPLALAPGMGLNAYFSFTVVQQMHVPWPDRAGLRDDCPGVAFSWC